IGAAAAEPLPGRKRQILHAPHADAAIDGHALRFHETVVGHRCPLERPVSSILSGFRLVPMHLVRGIVHGTLPDCWTRSRPLPNRRPSSRPSACGHSPKALAARPRCGRSRAGFHPRRSGSRRGLVSRRPPDIPDRRAPPGTRAAALWRARPADWAEPQTAATARKEVPQARSARAPPRSLLAPALSARPETPDVASRARTERARESHCRA